MLAEVVFLPGSGDFPQGSLADIGFHFKIPFLRDQRLQGPGMALLAAAAGGCTSLGLGRAPPSLRALVQDTGSLLAWTYLPNTRFNQRCMKLSGMRPIPRQKFFSLNKYRTRLPKGTVSPLDKYRLSLFVGFLFRQDHTKL